MGARELGLFLMCQAEDWMYASGHAAVAKAEQSTVYQVGCRGQLGPLDKTALGRQGKGADGDGG